MKPDSRFCSFSAKQARLVRFLLSTTDMTFGEIARRVRCAASTVGKFNRIEHIREYGGRRLWYP